MEFKDRIKTLRLNQGSTLEDIGNIVGVSKATVKRWESGEIANLRRDKIYKLAQALNTTPSYLMGWSDDASPRPSVTVCNKTRICGAAKREKITVYPPYIPQTPGSIRIAGRDGSFMERQLTDEQLALIQSMLDQMKPIDDENV